MLRRLYLFVLHVSYYFECFSIVFLFAAFFLHVPFTAESREVPFSNEILISDSVNQPYFVLAADMDGDGDKDVLCASFNSDRIDWFENNGLQIAGGHLVSSSIDGPRALYAVDIDRDGDMDVLSASYYGDKIYLHLNTGAGGFGSPITIAGGMDAAIAVYAEDVDGDGDLDVLAASYNSSQICWYENNGQYASYWLSITITTAARGPRSIEAVDVDGDGDVDVLSASQSDDKIAWHENSGDGSSWISHDISRSADEAAWVHAADLDGDGDLDVASASFADGKIAWYRNDDNASSWMESIITTEAKGAYYVGAADLDLDGDLDLISASYTDYKVAWYENLDGRGSFGSQKIIATMGERTRTAYAADLDGDGDVDVVSAQYPNDDKLVWFKNESIHRSALFPEQRSISEAAGGACSISAADVDRDGDLDILSAAMNDNAISWHVNDGLGEFLSSAVIDDSADGPCSTAAADLDRDGDVDAVYASQNGHEIIWRPNDGSGMFGAPQIVSQAPASPRQICAADLNGDGAQDLACASYDDDAIRWFANDGAGHFTAHILTDQADGPVSLCAVDLNCDGKLDVLYASENDNAVAWFANLGEGVFDSARLINSFLYTPSWIAAADLDGDGANDVIAASEAGDIIVWHSNDGAGNFGPAQIAANSLNAPACVFASDLDLDGDLDLAACSGEDDAVVWLENGGSGNFSEPQIAAAGADGARFVCTADLDGDGDSDLVSALFDGGKIVWLPNRGGQFAASAEDSAPSSIFQGETDVVLKITAVHRGRSGDAEAEIVRMQFLWEEAPGDPLSSDEANALIESFTLYKDDGSGEFDAADSAVVVMETLSLAGGVLAIEFVDGGAEACVPFGGPQTYFAVVQLTVDAAEQTPNRFRIVHLSEAGLAAEDRTNDIPLTIEYAPEAASKLISAAPNYDGVLIAGGGVIEPAFLDSMTVADDGAAPVFDFTIVDGGGGDGLPLSVSDIVLHYEGEDDLASRIAWRLRGADAANHIGQVDAAADAIRFSGLSLSVDEGQSETYTVYAFFMDNAGLQDRQSITLRIDGDEDVTLGENGSRMGAASPVGAVVTVQVDASQLTFVQQPASLAVISGQMMSFSAHPILEAHDAAGNIDLDFSKQVEISSHGAGASMLAGNLVAPVNGRATFPDLTLTYAATADHETFILQASSEGLASAQSDALSADVVATQLVFVIQPDPLSVVSGSPMDFSVDPVVEAHDENGVLDEDFAQTVVLSVNGAGAAVLTNETVSAVNGSASFQDFTIEYAATSDHEIFTLQASSDSLASAQSDALSADVVATHLVFAIQPDPLSVVSGSPMDFSVDPAVEAQDENGILDEDFAQ
ncbi:MAG: VCBS repeat-containing protein, partial [Candidatus Omnitrophica bacterium]|nr:VCBS repeat-containing protein [Candidatus Omnitrophota bacterium]